jgi:hypothetical protein
LQALTVSARDWGFDTASYLSVLMISTRMYFRDTEDSEGVNLSGHLVHLGQSDVHLPAVVNADAPHWSRV